LTESPVNILHDAGVKIALAQLEDDLIRDLPAEAAWVGKYLGLNDEESFKLVSQNIVEIMGLRETGEMVLWEGDALSGAGVVVGVLGA
jgi:pyrimidine operon attenuation protein/uracil phosphoribosyltransferase